MGIVSNEPPQDLTAEAAVLGACLISSTAVDDVIPLLNSGDFYKPAHQFIYDAIRELVSKGEPVDTLTVLAAVTERGDLRRIGGGEYLVTLSSTPPNAAAASSYAKIVRRMARKRRIAEQGIRWQQLAYRGETSDEELDATVAEAEKLLREMDQPASDSLTMSELIEDWQQWVDSPEGIIATPWDQLNSYLGGGLRRGKSYLIGGRPGQGKSLCGLNIALEAAEKGIPSLVFSLEMKRAEVASRLLAAGAWASYGEIFRKKMGQETWHRIEEYIHAKRDIPLEVVDRSEITVEEIAAHIRSSKAQLVFIDYLQLIKMTSGDSRREKIDHVSRTLKVTAGDCDVAMVVASQLNRETTKGGGRAPSISDLRESGGLEADADVVMLLWRPEGDDGILRLGIGKNRDGKMGTLELVFRGNLARLG